MKQPAFRERLARWQAMHRELFRNDPEFRKRHVSFLTAMLCLSIPLLAVYGYYFGVGLTSFAANLVVIFCVSAAMIYLSWRHFLFVNQRIASYSQSKSGA